ncbi:MAG: fumarylacetoacetate hydrolase family protein, partial [Candidatus Binatia bacterium]
MRFANHRGRATLVTKDGKGIDVERASGGRFGADPQTAYARWSELRDWARGVDAPGEPIVERDLGAPSP